MSEGSVTSTRAAAPVGAYPHARRVGNLLFLSGVGPRRPVTNEIPAGIEAQCRSCFANVRAILEDAGSGWDRIVDVEVFLTDMKRDFAAFNRLYAQASRTLDKNKRTALVHAMQKIQYDRGGYIIWSFQDSVDAYSKKVGGIQPIDKTAWGLNRCQLHKLYFK